MRCAAYLVIVSLAACACSRSTLEDEPSLPALPRVPAPSASEPPKPPGPNQDHDGGGGCDHSCPLGSSCSGGVCVSLCGADQVVCATAIGGFECVATATDASNCGACGHACASGDACIDSVCSFVCPPGQSVCQSPEGSKYCADTSSDPENCGTCGSVCAFPNAAQVSCSAGQCLIAACAGGKVDCDQIADNGCECNALACTTGVCGKLVFITSQVFGADLGGAPGGDQKCQDSADQAALGGSYMAWLSDDQSSPSTRFTHATVPYLRVDGVVVAKDWADLTDSDLDAPIAVTELGGPAPVGTAACDGPVAWTNTFANGTAWASFSNCDNWTSADAYSAFKGKVDATNWWWSLWCQGGCVGEAPLYCFEQ